MAKTEPHNPQFCTDHISNLLKSSGIDSNSLTNTATAKINPAATCRPHKS